MEAYTIQSDLQVMYMTAVQFPDTVPDAYAQLEAKIVDKSARRYFGYSQPNKDGRIIYKACAEILHLDEPFDYQLDTMSIPAGNYISIYIKNHLEDAHSIPGAFKKLLHHPQLDPNGYCLELYKNYTDPDVQCLVPIVP